jgi:hypothetical protein
MGTTLDTDKVLKLFKEEGLTVRQLKERFNTTSERIREIIKKSGLAIAGRRKVPDRQQRSLPRVKGRL